MRTRRLLAVMMAVAVVLPGCSVDDAPATADAEATAIAPGATAPTATSAAAEAATPMVVDTDAGQDDAIALLYLASSLQVDLRAVTVAGTGLAHCFPGAQNVLGLLELVGRSDVAVACGPEAPLAPGDVFRPFPDEWRRIADSRYGSVWPIGQSAPDDRAAPNLLVEAVRASPSKVTVLTLGPLTNLAAALALDQGLGERIERVVMMGGAFDVAGNTANAEPPPSTNVAEWNLFADPAAAHAVVHAGLPLTLVPLDATNQIPLDVYLLRAFARAPANPAVSVVRTLLAGLQPQILGGGYYLWDPLAAVLALRPDLGTIEAQMVDVVIHGVEAGRTVRVPAGQDGAQASLFTGADGRAAEAELVVRLAGIPEAAIDARPDLVIDAAACTTAGAPLPPGPAVLQVETPNGTGGAAIGKLAPGRGLADIEAFFAAPPGPPPDWFDITALLGDGPGTPSVDLVRLRPGEYTVVCVTGEWSAPSLAGTNTFSVHP